MAQDMQRIALAARPQGAPTTDNFRHETVSCPAPQDGEVLVEVTHLSLDPYMRGRMDDAKSYAKPVEVGATMEGGAVGTVLESRHKGFAPGDTVFGMLGWASHGVLPGDQLRKLPEGLPATTALGVLGMPGFTGWFGTTEYLKPQAGETLVVAAATGPVGSMVGQIAKARGARVVGVAGGAEKCRMAVETFGFDACIDHRAHEDAKSLRAAIEAECPKGIDCYFENVGGKVLEAVIPQMNVAGRIAVCGMIAWYDLGGLGAGGQEGRDNLPKVWRTILVQRLHVHGFIISDQWARFPEFLKEVAPMVGDGRVAYVEDIAEGLEKAPEAFLSMLKGGNTGKQVVRVKGDGA